MYNDSNACSMRLLKLLLFVFCSGWSTHALALDSVTVLADGNLGGALANVARSYSRDSNVVVNLSFAAADSQEMQINEGSAADVLITPRQSWIDELKTKGLIDIYSQDNFARDPLALVGPADSAIDAKLINRFPVSEIIRDMHYESLFVMPHPETLPEASAARDAMHGLEAADYMEPYTLYIKRPADMLDMVINQRAYGVFLNSSTRNKTGIKVLDFFPESSHRAFSYHAVVIAGDNMDAARKFIEYLKSKKAQSILKSYGLLEP